MSNTVSCRSASFINNKTPVFLTAKNIDLDTCYRDSEVVIKVHAAALNPVDVLTHNISYSLISNKKEKTFGRDYSGVIVKRGKNVDAAWQVGDEVNGSITHLFGETGALTDYLIVDPSKQPSISHLKSVDQSVLGEHDKFVVGASWPIVFCTAYGILTGFGQKLGPESKILVIGASTSVSNALIQIAKNHLNVGTVVGVCSKNSTEYNKKLGFDYLAPYDEGSMLENVGSILVGDLKNEKFDLIFDSVGNNSFFPVMDKFLKPKSTNSHYVTIVGDFKSYYSKPSMMDYIWILPRILNPFRGYNYTLYLVHPTKIMTEMGNKLVAEGKYKPAIDSVYPLSDFEQAIKRLDSNKTKGKVVVKIND